MKTACHWACHYYLAAATQSLLLAAVSPVVRAQDATGEYVSRKEYEELKTELREMKEELASLKKEKRAESKEKAKEPAAADMQKEVVAPAAEPEEPIVRDHKISHGRLEIEASGSGTNLQLEYAQLSYLLTTSLSGRESFSARAMSLLNVSRRLGLTNSRSAPWPYTMAFCRKGRSASKCAEDFP
jgi:hypothetical protein